MLLLRRCLRAGKQIKLCKTVDYFTTSRCYIFMIFTAHKLSHEGQNLHQRPHKSMMIDSRMIPVKAAGETAGVAAALLWSSAVTAPP